MPSFRPHLHGEVTQQRTFCRVSVTETTYLPHTRLQTHGHPGTYVSYVVAGAYNEIVGARDVWCETDVARFHRADEEHANRFSAHGATCLNIDFPDEMVTDRVVPSLSGRPVRLDSASFPALRVRRELWRPDSTSALVVEQLALELLDACVACGREQRAAGASRPVRRALDYIESHLADTLRLSDLARAADVHETHLARLFRSKLECTAGDVVRRRRVAAAQRQLRRQPAISLASLAVSVGFADHAHLSRTFRRIVGVSPSQYRRAIQL